MILYEITNSGVDITEIEPGFMLQLLLKYELI